MNTRFDTRLLSATLACAFTLLTGQVALGDDTEIFYGQNLTSGPAANPNVLLILDSSGSMSRSVPDDPFGRDRLEVMQDVAKDLIDDLNDVNMGIMKYDIRVGSGDAYSDGGMVVHPVADIASSRTSLKAEVDRIFHVGNTPLQETYYEAARYLMGEDVFYGLNSYEGYVWDNRYYARRRASVASSRIPYTNTYDSPLIGACQRNFVVYITDGAPTTDRNGTPRITSLLNDANYTEHAARACENPDGLTSGGECLDELAEFLYANDFNSSLPGKQNITSHFIGFAIDLPFLQRAADNGGGDYYTANDADQLKVALSEILNSVADESSGFTAPAVTVNAFDRTTHLDQLFFTVFQPNEQVQWDGNVKKYRYRPRSDGDGLTIIGKDNQPAVNPGSGYFYDGRDQTGAPDANVPTAWSYWSSAPDGAQVSKGGAAEQMTLNRNVITSTGGAMVPVNRDNNAMRAAMTGIRIPRDNGGQGPTAAGNDIDRWLDWAAGIDVNDEDEDNDNRDARQSMGDPLHSKPAVVVYGGDSDDPDVTLFVGTNDGAMRAIDGKTGVERFAFVPETMWSSIPIWAENPKLGTTDRTYGVDGPVMVWKNDGGDGKIDAGSSDFVYLYFGLRRGGKAYYALDVTDPDNPKYMWDFSRSDSGTLGQTWSLPVRTNVNFGTDDSPNKRDVLIFGGGYDADQDDATSYDQDDEGNAIYIVDAVDGSLLWSAGKTALGGTYGSFVSSDMQNSFPAGVRALDMSLDGSANRMYTVDIAGRMWRFDIHNEDSFKITGGVIAELGGSDQGNQQNNRRFYYAPDVALGSAGGQAFVTITAASGFRAHPLSGTIRDYLFGVRDYNPFSVLGEDDLDDYDYDIDIDDLVTLSTSSTVSVPAGSDGFKLALSTSEKSLARSRIFQNQAYYSTYEPGAAPASNPCAPAVGSGALYTIDLETGGIQRTDLNKSGIPPEPTFIFGAPDDPETIYSNCFGSHCPEPPEPPTCDAGSPDCDDDGEWEQSDPSGREVECLMGPESCNADGNEFPVRTYWRQVDQTQ